VKGWNGEIGTFLPQTPVSRVFGKKVGALAVQPNLAKPWNEATCDFRVAVKWPEFLATGPQRLAIKRA
jgi:hypothetical protein